MPTMKGLTFICVTTADQTGAASKTMTSSYDRQGVHFVYPENWKLSENRDADGFLEVSLESPTGCIWSASLFPAQSDSEELLQSTAGALGEQYDELEITHFEGNVGDFPSNGFNADFYCLDFLVTAQARVFQAANHTIHVFCQAESREFEELRDVFAAITISLLRGD